MIFEFVVSVEISLTKSRMGSGELFFGVLYPSNLSNHFGSKVLWVNSRVLCLWLIFTILQDGVVSELDLLDMVYP